MSSCRVLILIAFVTLRVDVMAAEPISLRETGSNISPEAQAVAKSSRDFSLELYRSLATSRSGNLFCSPHSALGTLLMAAEGTRGETADQMGKVLHFPSNWRLAAPADGRSWDTKRMLRGMGDLQTVLLPRETDAVRAQRKKLQEAEARLAQLKAKTGEGYSRESMKLVEQQRPLVQEVNRLRQELDQYELRIANAVWCDERFPLRADYRQTVNGAYGASANSVDFFRDAEAARLRINGWAGDQTKGLIKDILKPGTVDSMTKLVLTNAVYFKGNWQTPFDKRNTKDEPFWVSSQDKITVPLMTKYHLGARYVELRPDGTANVPVKKAPPQNSEFRFVWELPQNPDGWKLIELPYRGGSLSMLVILPNRRDGLADLKQQLSGEQLAAWTKAMSGQSVHTFLPRFKLRTTFEMGKELASLGMASAFVPGGFTGLSDSREARDVYIGAVIQEAYVDVNEEGTEAAAVTAIAMPTAAALRDPDPPTPEFRADHPFLCLIRDSRTEAVLFVGRYAGKD